MIQDCNEDAKHRPESDDFKHHLRLEDRLIAIDGHELPHIYAHQKRKTLAAMFGHSKRDVLSQIEEQQKEVDAALKEIEADKDYDSEKDAIKETDDAVSLTPPAPWLFGRLRSLFHDTSQVSLFLYLSLSLPRAPPFDRPPKRKRS